MVGGVLLVFPVVWPGRMILDRQPTTSRAVWVTMFVHYAVGIPFSLAIIRAATTHQNWSDWTLPIPIEIGLLLVIVTGAAFLLTVGNLALKGHGAPFAIALSRKLAAGWLYAWTRNPMALAALACLLSLGIWFQSTLFVLWVVILFTPALRTGNPIWSILPGVQIQNANVAPKRTKGDNAGGRDGRSGRREPAAQEMRLR
jgi:protein-S-isoprenylcysteine O-methyltransferase Ste14